MGSRYNYVKKLTDSAQDRARGFHKEFQEYDDLANRAHTYRDSALEGYFRGVANAKLNDFFYWIGHSNAYRGIGMQVEMWEDIDREMEEEGSCP